MTAPYHPQAAAAEARANYREVTARLGALGFDTAIPEGVRALAESTVDQTREACDRSTDAFEASVGPSRNPSTLPAKAPPPSTARSSTSPGGISILASTWPRA